MADASPRLEEPAGGGGELLEMVVETNNAHARVALRGEIDLSTAPKLEVALHDVATGDGIRHVMVDLDEVTFIDSSGIHVLCRAASVARQDGFDFGVTRLSHNIRRLFVLAGVDQVVPVFEH